MNLGWVFILGVVFLIAYLVVTRGTPVPQTDRLVAANALLSDQVQNPANDWLLVHNGAARAERLGRVVGEGCKGQTAFYQGTIKTVSHVSSDPRPQAPVLPGTENDAFWSVRCADGRSYEVEVHPNGRGQVLECSVLKRLHASECFKKF